MTHHIRIHIDIQLFAPATTAVAGRSSRAAGSSAPPPPRPRSDAPSAPGPAPPVRPAPDRWRSMIWSFYPAQSRLPPPTAFGEDRGPGSGRFICGRGAIDPRALITRAPDPSPLQSPALSNAASTPPSPTRPPRTTRRSPLRNIVCIVFTNLKSFLSLPFPALTGHTIATRLSRAKQPSTPPPVLFIPLDSSSSVSISVPLFYPRYATPTPIRAPGGAQRVGMHRPPPSPVLLLVILERTCCLPLPLPSKPTTESHREKESR